MFLLILRAHLSLALHSCQTVAWSISPKRSGASWNGGLCEESLKGPICQCHGYTGDKCTLDINECQNANPCNGSTCTNANGSFKCQCPTGTPYCHPFLHQLNDSVTNAGRDYAFKLEELVGIISSLFGLIVFLWVMCRRFKFVKANNNWQATNARSYNNDF